MLFEDWRYGQRSFAAESKNSNMLKTWNQAGHELQ